jgi:hypothetical protein
MRAMKSYTLYGDTLHRAVERLESVLEALVSEEGNKIVSINFVPLAYPGGFYGIIFYSQEEA